MAKGSSVFAAETLITEAAGEYRRTVARTSRGRAAGTCDADRLNQLWHEHMESRMQWKLHVRFGGGPGKPTS